MKNMGVLGFACMQSAFVLINQLHRGSKPPSARIVELLKFDFLVLAAVRKFHWPARHWVCTGWVTHIAMEQEANLISSTFCFGRMNRRHSH